MCDFSDNLNITNKQNYCKGLQGKWVFLPNFTRMQVLFEIR